MREKARTIESGAKRESATEQQAALKQLRV